jgi:predicted nucleic acid-binding protein
MILIDLNVLLDVLQERRPHFLSSAALLDHLLQQEAKAWIPAHAITTIHYLVARHASRNEADQAVDWLLARFRIASISSAELMRARALALSDYEDAVVVAAAEQAECETIVTRNIRDFKGFPIPVSTPEEYLASITS